MNYPFSACVAATASPQVILESKAKVFPTEQTDETTGDRLASEDLVQYEPIVTHWVSVDMKRRRHEASRAAAGGLRGSLDAGGESLRASQAKKSPR